MQVFKTLLLIVVLGCSVCAAYAQDTGVHWQEKQLEQDQKHQAMLLGKSGAPSLDEHTLVQDHLKDAALQYAATQLDVNNVKLSLTQVGQVIQNARKSLQAYREQAQELAFFAPSATTQAQQKSIEAKIANQQSIVQINQQRQEVLLKSLTILNHLLSEEKNQLHSLQEHFIQQQKLAQQTTVEKQVADLNAQQNMWLKKIVALNKAIDPLDPQSDHYQTVARQLLVAQENSNLLQIEISLTHDRVQLSLLSTDDDSTLSVTNLNQQRQDLNDLAEHLGQVNQLIDSKLDLLKQRQTILQGQGNSSALMDAVLLEISMRYQQYNAQVQKLDSAVGLQKTINTERLAKALARRQGLPGFSWFEWVMLGQGFVQMEVMSSQAIQGIAKDIAMHTLELSWFKIGRLLASLAVLGVIGYGLTRFLSKQLQRCNVAKVDFRSRFYIGVVRIVRAHLKWLLGFSWFIIFLAQLGIGDQWFRLIAYLLMTALAFSLAFASARVGLYENLSSNVGDDVKLYFRLFWILVFGAVVTVCLVLSQQLNVMYEVQDFFNRMFTLFVLLLALMLLKAWQVVPQLIIPYINVKHNYLIRVTKLLGVLIPLIILSSALIGIVGYVELAWTISKYEGIFVLFVIAYLIGKGLLNEGLTWLADFCIGQFRSGWLLTEAVLKPVSKWLHIALFIGVVYLLLFSYGIAQQDFFATYYYQLMHFTLISFSTTNITLWVLIKAILVALAFAWAVHWSREFCYRRLYLGIRDIGARNSLAIFTQYGIVLLGLLVTLKVLQIDLTVLALVFSGFAVGIGFGLRDLANNFSCGLLLLIERPMRRGDTVAIGLHEGVVMHIGMRAITLVSSDNGEVVVPNSEVFSKIFINWTRQDDVVRCEVTIKVSREEDPHALHDIIKAAVVASEGILEKPTPTVLLKSLQDTVLEFEVRFHINYRLHDSRTMMKSLVLFNIWRSFHELGVKAPHPQQDIHIKSLPEPEDRGQQTEDR